MTPGPECPSGAKKMVGDLTAPQIYRIGTMFWDDKYGTHGLSQEVSYFYFFLVHLLHHLLSFSMCFWVI